MTTLTDSTAAPRRTSKLPHPRRRVPILGDVLAFDMDTPSQSAAALAAELGPLYEMRVLASHRAIIRPVISTMVAW